MQTPEAMNIRDEFAIRILASVIAVTLPASDEETAHCCMMSYRTADMMLKERIKQNA